MDLCFHLSIRFHQLEQYHSFTAYLLIVVCGSKTDVNIKTGAHAPDQYNTTT